MSGLAIAAVTSGSAANALNAAQIIDAHQRAVPATNSNAQQDTASLSPTARALALYREGETVPVVAVAMNSSVATIDGYLNITSQTSLKVYASATSGTA